MYKIVLKLSLYIWAVLNNCHIRFKFTLPRYSIHQYGVIQKNLSSIRLGILLMQSLADIFPVFEVKVSARIAGMKNNLFNIFFSSEGRGLLLETICTHLRQHLDSRLELVLCGDVLSDIVILTHKHVKKYPHSKVRYDYLCNISRGC